MMRVNKQFQFQYRNTRAGVKIDLAICLVELEHQYLFISLSRFQRAEDTNNPCTGLYQQPGEEKKKRVFY